MTVLRQSTFYETSPVDFVAQPFFINNVVEVATNLSAEKLLEKIGAIEAYFNVQPKIKKGPRVIDLDILVYRDTKANTETLQLPHPRICQRKFVLIPLLEIDPEAHCQTDRRPFRDCLNRLNDATQTVEVYHG